MEYQRLVDSGELEKYLVDAPSAGKLAASKVLGFSLIAMGLSLLTRVGIGFFTGGYGLCPVCGTCCAPGTLAVLHLIRLESLR